MDLERKHLCPLWREKCKQLDCEWFIKVHGTDPQDNERIIEEWGCAIVFQFSGLLEVAKRVSGGLDGVQRATESMRNETVAATRATLESLVELAERQVAPRLDNGGSRYAIDHNPER